MNPRVAGKLSGVLVAVALAAPVHAAPEFFGVPNSDRVLQGSLTLPDGKTVRFGSREGTMVSVRDDAKHYWVAFQGVFEQGVERTTVRLFDVEPMSDDEAALDIHGRLPKEIAMGTSHEFSHPSGTFTFSYQAVTQGHFPKQPFDPRQATTQQVEKNWPTGDGICCVTCGSATACASSVISDCGSCNGGRWQ